VSGYSKGEERLAIDCAKGRVHIYCPSGYTLEGEELVQVVKEIAASVDKPKAASKTPKKPKRAVKGR